MYTGHKYVGNKTELWVVQTLNLCRTQGADPGGWGLGGASKRQKEGKKRCVSACECNMF